MSTATLEPLLLPPGSMSFAYVPYVCPPRALQPLSESLERKLAHSDMFAVPRMTQPADRSCLTTGLSWSGLAPTSASEPAVASIFSNVTTLSLIKMGTPWRGLRAGVNKICSLGHRLRHGVAWDALPSTPGGPQFLV